MKKTFVLLGFMSAIISCGNNDTKNTSTATTPSNDTKTVDISKNPDYQKGLALVGKNDCLGCHKVAETSVGPAYTEVAKRYAGKPGIEDTLAQKIIKGGAGHWGEVPMAAHPQITEDDAKAMAKYVLTLNQQ